VGRVVAAMVDPDPRTAGKGIARLRSAGVLVEVGCEKDRALELNHVFVSRQRRGRPFIALKIALSADGCIAAADGSPATITGEEARRHAHQVRAGLDAILVGVETLQIDRPRLDRRLYPGPGGSRPRRLVLDPDLRSLPEWLWPGEARPVLFCRSGAREARGRELEGAAELVVLPEVPGSAGSSRLDLRALPEVLAGLGLWSLLVEGGGRTQRAFFEAGLWDRFYLYSNPDLRLGGKAWEAADDWARESDGLSPIEARMLGPDRLSIYAHPALQDA
jgi:diaminohydroxyphosphoribosylaminopyrimidine deaminase/5-amino-6-(5-phosphoribosylamino)uracil reductase